jgi:hypothetical protein
VLARGISVQSAPHKPLTSSHASIHLFNSRPWGSPTAKSSSRGGDTLTSFSHTFSHTLHTQMKLPELFACVNTNGNGWLSENEFKVKHTAEGHGNSTPGRF